MKYILLLMIYTSTGSAPDWFLNNTITLEFDSMDACESVGNKIWEPFEKIIDNEVQQKGINMFAWCIDSQGKESRQLLGVGIKPKKKSDPKPKPKPKP